MPQIFPCVYAVLQQNNLAMQGREEVAITPQCHQCCGVTVHRVLSLLCVPSREATQLLTNVSLQTAI